MNTETESFRLVTKEEFFAKVGPMNVHPTPFGPYNQRYGYTSHWTLPNGTIVGASDDERYWLYRYR